MTYKASPTEASSGGSGATHTVIVAPTQGVLRYIPFAVNASVGDTIKFMWGANNHTVTKSSSLLPCNKTADALFASGTQNKDFVFTQVVNDTSPTFFYCATPTHCQKGMFGIINPPNALAGAPSSVGSMMPALAANVSDTCLACSLLLTKGFRTRMSPLTRPTVSRRPPAMLMLPNGAPTSIWVACLSGHTNTSLKTSCTPVPSSRPTLRLSRTTALLTSALLAPPPC